MKDLSLTSFPFYPMEGGLIRNAPIGMCAGLISDFIWQGEPYSVTTYGESRLYRPIVAKIPIAIGKQFTNSRVMILWED